jgi:hypothetical protein
VGLGVEITKVAEVRSYSGSTAFRDGIGRVLSWI